MGVFKIGVLDFETVGQGSAEGSRLAGNAKPYNRTKMFTDAIKAAGHIPVVYKVEKCQMFFGEKAVILYNNKKIKGCDVLIPRIDFSLGIDLEISIIKQFQLMGIPVLNQYLPISRAKNKLRTLQILTRSKIPVPKTIIARRIQDVDEAVKRIGGYPVVIKVPFGSYGREVALLESRRSLYSALDILLRRDTTSIFLVQEYVAESDNCDYRAFVVGDKVIASMKRQARAGDFRSNLELGGTATSIALSDDEQKIAVRAAKSVGLSICGVDLLHSKNGPVVMEINANPGLKGITDASGVDVAGEIIKYAAKVAHQHKTQK
ncbi:MAG TPA: RimK family alpha-L-glutamate ligase [Candidatus Gracilibacteria bacterium]|nr:RimK family alpha-L-glutamate ligase [Candidatus Gracilibacteria bacterium]